MLITYPVSLQDNTNILIPLIFYVNHKMMISFKYATLSFTEYERIRQCKSYEQSRKYQSQLQILTGIAHKQTMKFEIDCAAARGGISEEQMYFLLPEPTSHFPPEC